jgi:hypothetical protein
MKNRFIDFGTVKLVTGITNRFIVPTSFRSS